MRATCAHADRVDSLVHRREPIAAARVPVTQAESSSCDTYCCIALARTRRIEPSATHGNPAESARFDSRTKPIERTSCPATLEKAVSYNMSSYRTLCKHCTPPYPALCASAAAVSSAVVLLQAAAVSRHASCVFGFVASPPPPSSPSSLLSRFAASGTAGACGTGHTTPTAVAASSTAVSPFSVRPCCTGNSGNRRLAPETCMMAAASTTGKEEVEEEGAFVFPSAPLPEIIVSNVPGSWAYDTMVREYLEVFALRKRPRRARIE